MNMYKIILLLFLVVFCSSKDYKGLNKTGYMQHLFLPTKVYECYADSLHSNYLNTPINIINKSSTIPEIELMIKDSIISDILNKRGGKVNVIGKVVEIVDTVHSGEPFLVLSDTINSTDFSKCFLRCFFIKNFLNAKKGEIIIINGRINGGKFPFIDLVCCSKI